MLTGYKANLNHLEDDQLSNFDFKSNHPLPSSFYFFKHHVCKATLWVCTTAVCICHLLLLFCCYAGFCVYIHMYTFVFVCVFLCESRCSYQNLKTSTNKSKQTTGKYGTTVSGVPECVWKHKALWKGGWNKETTKPHYSHAYTDKGAHACTQTWPF